MLQLLHIENIAVIERADISFRAGFNALTGETGAGKSIVIDSLGAVLGARTSRDLIRTGAAKAFVSAEFDGVDASLPVLAALGVEPEDGVLLLQRDIYADGKNICRANGRPITVAQLRALGTSLLNIHGQHEGTQLLDEEQHGAYLDRFARLDGLPEAYTARYQAVRETQRQIEALEMDEAEKARRVDTLRHQIAELERAELRDGEEEELLARRELLRNAEKFMDAFAAADYALSGGDDGLGAASQLKNAENALHSVRALGARFSELCERLESLYSDVYDLAETVRDLRSEMDFSPQELDAVESRADQLYRLKKKYGATVGEMLDYLERSKKELDEIEFAGDRVEQLKGKLQKAEKAAWDAALRLREARKEAAAGLTARILEELSQLDMKKVQFSCEFTETELSPVGADAVAFYMSANLGEALKPLNKVASGGELARIMLALKNVLAERDRVPTLIFDEVDTGVSGRAAQRVAEKLLAVSRTKQVLCVTHLPQLAALADTHFRIAKREADGRTYTSVTPLDFEGRRQELARIIGGASITETTLQSAGEMLKQRQA